jgi:single stranded DNA-binding protein (ssb)
MNIVVLSGNLTKDPVIKRVARKDTGEVIVVGRYGFAVDREISRQVKDDNSDMQKADFVSVVVFGGKAEFAEKYLKKGTRIVLRGKLRSGDYINKYNQRVFLTEVLAEKQEFAEKRRDEKREGSEDDILDNMNIFSPEDYEFVDG